MEWDLELEVRDGGILGFYFECGVSLWPTKTGREREGAFDNNTEFGFPSSFDARRRIVVE